jgi:hypothetical protein
MKRWMTRPNELGFHDLSFPLLLAFCCCIPVDGASTFPSVVSGSSSTTVEKRGCVSHVTSEGGGHGVASMTVKEMLVRGVDGVKVRKAVSTSTTLDVEPRACFSPVLESQTMGVGRWTRKLTD